MPNDEQSAEERFAGSPRPRAYCPLCEPTVDPVKEFVSPLRCSTHHACDIGSPDDPIAEVGASGLYTGDADPVLGRAIERIIREADKERRDRAA